MMFTLNARARLTTALALAAALLVSVLGPLPSVGSAAEPGEPVARLQVLVTKIHIHNDRDWGSGEMKLTAVLREENGGPTPLASMSRAFSASSGDDVILDRLVPGEGDTMVGGVSPVGGLPVYAGHRYFFGTKVTESDSVSTSDNLGDVVAYMHQEDGWGIGTYTIRSRKMPSEDIGDYDVTFEIRRAPLPDLRPVNIKVNDLAGGAKKQVCVAVQNVEVGHAGSFDMTLSVNGTVPPGGRATQSGPAPGNHVDACVEIDPPAPGEHRFKAVVDPSRTLLEYNETNNAYEQTHAIAPPPSDLIVTTIRVNGRLVDGKDDCKKGQNDVAVVVKNGGTADAGTFAVRLAVDGVEAAVVSVDGLDAGLEREVRFDDLRLKNGKRALVATVDAKGDITESKEDNNDRAVTAECKDDD
jgi:hypothetical protein